MNIERDHMRLIDVKVCLDQTIEPKTTNACIDLEELAAMCDEHTLGGCRATGLALKNGKTLLVLESYESLREKWSECERRVVLRQFKD